MSAVEHTFPSALTRALVIRSMPELNHYDAFREQSAGHSILPG